MRYQRRFACFSRLAARFSSRLLAGFFFASFFRSIPLLMAGPSVWCRVVRHRDAWPASPAWLSSWPPRGVSSFPGNLADASDLLVTARVVPVDYSMSRVAARTPPHGLAGLQERIPSPAVVARRRAVPWRAVAVIRVPHWRFADCSTAP